MPMEKRTASGEVLGVFRRGNGTKEEREGSASHGSSVHGHGGGGRGGGRCSASGGGCTATVVWMACAEAWARPGLEGGLPLRMLEGRLGGAHRGGDGTAGLGQGQSHG